MLEPEASPEDLAEITAAVIAALPDDVPPEHEAHQRIKYTLGGNAQKPCAQFKYKIDGHNVHFQATLGACGSKYATLRVARACYALVEQGLVKQDVLQFREECYEKISAALKGGSVATTAEPKKPLKTEPDATAAVKAGAIKVDLRTGWQKVTLGEDTCYEMSKPGTGADLRLLSTRPTGADVADASARLSRVVFCRLLGRPELLGVAAVAAVDSEVKRDKDNGKRKDDGKRKAKLEKTEPDAIVQAAILEEDVPPGHEAHSKVKFKKGHGGEDGAFYMQYEHERLQVTPGKAGSLENAARIARLCYAKFMEGQTKDDVLQYRDKLCAKMVAGLSHQDGGSKAPKRQKRDGNSEGAAIIAQLQAEQRLAGAMQILGRDAAKNAASINGTYAVLRDAFAGFRAYEKVNGGKRRYVFFSKKKMAWKVSDSLDDKTAGFATVSAASGQTLPTELGPDAVWQVFDGKGQGQGPDPAVRCEKLAGAPDSTSSALVQEEARQSLGPASGSVSASGSSSDESSESASEDGSDSSAASSDKSGTVPSSSPPGSSPPDRSPVAYWKKYHGSAPAAHLQPPPRGHVCAKMLVKAGIRCQCHFCPVLECPAR